ncbi:MAG: hypothetical protein MHM6MM_001787 [Cercozoa sp. M6MM]
MIKSLLVLLSVGGVVAQPGGLYPGMPDPVSGKSSCCVGLGCEHYNLNCSPYPGEYPACSITCPVNYAAHCFCNDHLTPVCECRDGKELGRQ